MRLGKRNEPKLKEDGDPSAKTPFSTRLLFTGGGVAVASAVALGWIWFQDPDPESGTLSFEAAKVLMQVLGVVLLGGIFSFTVAALQVRHQEDAARQDRQHQVSERRRAEQQDRRQRLDDLRRGLLDQTVANYNMVKRSRRRLRDAGYRGQLAGKVVAVNDVGDARKICGEQRENLIEAQLEFERLRKLAPLVMIPGLEGSYADCAKYLKGVYENFGKSPAMPAPGDEGEGLSRFLGYRRTQARASFSVFARTAQSAVDNLRKSLLSPIRLTVVPTDAIGVDAEALEGQLTDFEFVVHKVNIDSPAPKDSVVATIPGPGEPLTADQAIVIVASNGKPADVYTQATVADDIIGADAGEAETSLQDQKLDIKKIGIDSGRPKGAVVATYPVPGATTQTGTIILLVSRGP